MTIKQLDPPAQLAQLKYPHLAWAGKARVPIAEFLDHWCIAQRCVGGPAGILKANSHSFTVVMRD
eukprot:10084648-Karenia_brevis.AAC.1